MRRNIAAICLLVTLGIGLGYLAFSQVVVPCIPILDQRCNDRNCTGGDCKLHRCRYGIAYTEQYQGPAPIECCNSTTRNFCCDMDKLLVYCYDENRRPCSQPMPYRYTCKGIRNYTCMQTLEGCVP